MRIFYCAGCAINYAQGVGVGVLFCFVRRSEVIGELIVKAESGASHEKLFGKSVVAEKICAIFAPDIIFKNYDYEN